MPFDVSSVDDNASDNSTISSIFDGDLSGEIDQLRSHRRVLYSDAIRLQSEYRRFLNSPVDEKEDHCHEFDAFKNVWVLSLCRYVDSARTMYSARTISLPHYRAAAKAVERLVVTWNTTPYVTDDCAARIPLPSVDDILEATACGRTAMLTHSTSPASYNDAQRTHSGRTAMPTPCSDPRLPSDPSPGPNIEAWLKDVERSSTSGEKIPVTSAAEAEVETENVTKTPEVTATTTDDNLRHIPPPNSTLFVLFRDLKKEMESLVRENEQLRLQLANAEAAAAENAYVEKEREWKEWKQKEAAIQRAEKAEKERDEMIDGFIRTRISHLANQTMDRSHRCTTEIDQLKKNLQSWLASLQGMTATKSQPIASVTSSPRPSVRPDSASLNETRTAAL